MIEELSPRRDGELARRILEVQKAAYTVEAQLIGDDRIPPLHETVQDLQAADLTWFGSTVDGHLCGAVAVFDDGDGITIDRLVVDPARHRRGVGAALVAAVLTVAGGRPVTVSTGRANVPARALYLRAGFVESGDVEVLPGLWITHFRHSNGHRGRPAPCPRAQPSHDQKGGGSSS